MATLMIRRMTSPKQTMSKTSKIRLLMLVVPVEYFSWPRPANPVSGHRNVCGAQFSWSSWYFGNLFWSLDSDFKATIAGLNLISTDLGWETTKESQRNDPYLFFKSKIGDVNRVRLYGCWTRPTWSAVFILHKILMIKDAQTLQIVTTIISNFTKTLKFIV